VEAANALRLIHLDICLRQRLAPDFPNAKHLIAQAMLFGFHRSGAARI